MSGKKSLYPDGRIPDRLPDGRDGAGRWRPPKQELEGHVRLHVRVLHLVHDLHVRLHLWALWMKQPTRAETQKRSWRPAPR